MYIHFILLVCFVATIGILLDRVATQSLNSLQNVTNGNDSSDLTSNNGSAYFLDDNGMPVLGLFNGVNTFSSNESNRQRIQFYLFIRQDRNETYRLFVDDIQLLKNSPFNPQYPTIILIHGFTNSIESGFVQKIKDAYMEKDYNLNVIAVDWSSLSKAPWYYSAVLNTITVGKYVARFVDLLVDEMNLNLKYLHIIGHSLGAHVAGIVSKNIQSSGKISRITGLDPAFPLYATAGKERKLTREDADFVDIIHTSSGTFGLLNPLGQMDFYPNGGVAPQPGCELDLHVGCSHDRAWELYAESVKNPKAFPTKGCENVYQATTGICDSNRDDSPYMGADAYLNAGFDNGLFYTKTQSQSPYAINEID